MAAMRLSAGQKRPTIIHLPHLTLFATGIPKFVYGALNRKALENGLLGRCLFIETDDFQPLGEMSAAELPRSLVETATKMAAREKAFNETGVLVPVVIAESSEAKEKLRELRFNADEISRRLFESDLETAAALYCRLYEKAVKLAALYAVSENPEAPLMSAEAVRWAAAFATHVTKKMLYESQFNLAEGQFDRLKKRFVGLLAKAGGQLDRATLLKKMHIDATTFQRIALTLHMSDMIEEETLSRRKTLYTLKKAA